MSRDDGVPWGRPTGLTSLTWLSIPTQVVYIDSLIAMQEGVYFAPLIDPRHRETALDRFPHVVRFDGESYLEDGHTRTVKAMLLGKRYIVARVLTL